MKLIHFPLNAILPKDVRLHHIMQECESNQIRNIKNQKFICNEQTLHVIGKGFKSIYLYKTNNMYVFLKDILIQTKNNKMRYI